MKVSIITAFFHGNRYMGQYMEMLQKNQNNLSEGDELEAVIVNDSPETEVILPEEAKCSQILVVRQEKNGGIHAARVKGLKLCSGDYVIFLDQDDMLADNAIAEHIAAIKRRKREMRDTDGEAVTVSNAVLEQKDWREIWYRTAYHKRKVGDWRTYLNIGNQIISPGQCLIPKARIPESWKNNICKKNGADDYYLWLLLLAKKTPFVMLDKPLYIHKYTSENLSSDTKKMDASTYEFAEFLEKNQEMKEKELQLLLRTVRFKDAFRTGNIREKIILGLKNPDILIPNVVFKLRTKTPYGFNRS